ncbi:MAG TPA: DUF6088 family protein, partial [Burkholderiaceae bacterium]|nr:DUF6088 family protein [Burkholderiaceae bacterium]
MHAHIPLIQTVQQRIEQIPFGEPFRTATFLEDGTRAAVNKALSRLTKAGMIERISRGMFVRPAVNHRLGRVLPEPQQIVESLAKANGEIV